MGKCPAWHEGDKGLSYFSHDRCYGTKEIEVCECLGNEAFCDFYPEKRKAAAHPKFGEWISVKDRLPPHQGKKVLVVNGHGDVRIYALWKREYGNKWTWIDENGKFNHVNDITHWMPLPEPPKEDEKDENT